MTDNRVTETGITHLQGLLEWLERDTALPATRRRDYRSAIRKVGDLTGQPLDRLPAHLGLLRPHLDKVHPAMAGLSPKRWQNIRSDLKRAIEYGRSKGLLRSLSREPLSPAWQPLYEKLEGPQLRNGLGGFMRFCAGRDISPDQVRDTLARDYFDHLTGNTLRRHPAQVFRDTCRLWNKAAAQYDVFPDIQLTVPSFKPLSKTESWETFPARLRNEVDRHVEWLSGRDVLSDHQPPHACKPSTCRLRRKQLHLLASAAVRGGVAIEALTSLETLVSRPIVEKAIQQYLDENGGNKTQYVHDLVKTLRLVAKHWVNADEAHLTWLRDLLRRLNPKRSGLTPKNREMLRQFEDEANLQRLLALSDKLTGSARRLNNPCKAAVRYQLGLIISVLLHAPMRISNLASLHLDRHITRPGGPRGGIDIVLGDHETKNAEAQAYRLGPSTQQMVEIYLQHHRPHLVRGQDDGWLWPGAAKHHKSARTVAQQLQQIILKETGLRITPHQFRHLAALLILDAQPGAYELARCVLGHRNTKTTVGFYTGLESRSAVARYDQIIEDRRRGSERR